MFPAGNGTYYFASTLLLDGRRSLIGGAAAERYAKETGSPEPVVQAARSRLIPIDLTVEMIDSLIWGLRHLLGEAYDEMMSFHTRRANRGTPPKSSHRMCVLAANLSSFAESHRRQGEGRHPVASREIVEDFTELTVFNNILARWRHNPAWTGILSALKSPDNFLHDVGTLLVAAVLADCGNCVSLYVETREGVRAGDIRVALSTDDHAVVEVKAPNQLRYRREPLDRTLARKAVHRCLGSAGTGSSGQLNPDRNGILAIACFRLSSADWEMLAKTADQMLTEPRHSRRHIAGVVLTNVDTEVKVYTDCGKPRSALDSSIRHEIVKNPLYHGDMNIVKKGTM
jgi:hypothetical protein